MALALVVELANFYGADNTVKTSNIIIKHIAKVERVLHNKTVFNFVGEVIDKIL